MQPAEFDNVAEGGSRALITGDYELYRSVMGLPLRVEPRGGQSMVNSNYLRDVGYDYTSPK